MIECPVSVGRVQSDKFLTTPRPVFPRSASTPASAPISLRYEDEDRLRINIWSEDKKKTVEIVMGQEYTQQSGMRSLEDYMKFSSRGLKNRVRVL